LAYCGEVAWSHPCTQFLFLINESWITSTFNLYVASNVIPTRNLQLISVSHCNIANLQQSGMCLKMCGVVGLVAGKNFPFSVAKLEKMASRISHRGPDSHGTWNRDGAYLGHRRLAIVDLTVAGHQPMMSQDGRYVVTYNGEIYNHLDIRVELEADATIIWRGHSDTETLVEALSRWGVAKTLDRLNGMFAFALWDIRARKLILARDPFGEKPLLYGIQGDTIVFASELTAIRTVPEFKTSPDPAAVARYLENWSVPAPLTIVKGVSKLPPGCYLEWQANVAPVVKSYWSVSDIAQQGRNNLITNEADALDELDALFRDAVKIRMMSDVPLGALLSGGVDSSLVVALMQQTQTNAVRTFTIGFEDEEVNEAPHAAAIAGHLGTRHETLFLTETEAIETVPKLGSIYDEPFADASQLPTYLVSALARQHVTVALSGDGCDELFSGYARHTMAQTAWQAISRIPGRKWLGPKVSNLPPALLSSVARLLKPLIPAGVNPNSLQKKLAYSGNLLSAGSADEIYQSYMTSWPNPSELLQTPVVSGEKWRPTQPVFDNLLDQFVWQDCIDYLPNDILTKVDRASMAVSLETRIPPLDKRIAALAWRLPQNMRWRDGVGKWALRQVLYRHVPRELVDRPKRGFAVPLDTWLRHPLRAWSEDLLEPSRIRKQGLLNPDVVSAKLKAFQTGRSTSAPQIWTLLMLQSWLEANEM
jgi:asparagine synthase (glutamine-hydrolysing)